LANERAENRNPYPHKFNRDMTIPQFIEKYKEMEIETGKFLEDKKIAITGRIMGQGIREQGTKLIFFDLEEDNDKVQIYANA